MKSQGFSLIRSLAFTPVGTRGRNPVGRALRKARPRLRSPSTGMQSRAGISVHGTELMPGGACLALGEHSSSIGCQQSVPYACCCTAEMFCAPVISLRDARYRPTTFPSPAEDRQTGPSQSQSRTCRPLIRRPRGSSFRGRSTHSTGRKQGASSPRSSAVSGSGASP